MEPVTHFLTGAVLARAGLNRRAAYTTLAMTLAAEAPDLDVAWSFRGPVTGFEHHRGLTHAFLGLPFEAALVLVFVYAIHRWRLHRNPALTTQAPIRWPLLFVFALIALLSHLFLDWTNNYGLRPFLPFNPRWYAASIVFIVEPVMLAFLLLAFAGPALTGLIGSEISSGSRRQPFRGRSWAVAALLGIVAFWSLRFFEQSRALQLARAEDYGGAEVLRIQACPYPFNPFQWHAVVETPTFYQLATIDTLNSTVATSTQADVFYKPAETPALQAARASYLGRVYLDWSSAPLVTESGTSSAGITEVTFRDLRFLYDIGPLHSRDHPPLSGIVRLNPNHQVTRMEMDDRPQN